MELSGYSSNLRNSSYFSGIPPIKWAVWGRMYNTGQTCCAAKRFIVVEELAEKFLDKFQSALVALKPGDPLDEKTTLGPL
jgi:succinate-semialdehyde dehydrogenase/glutarate-semialdehyde dehydrogenase